MHCVQCRSFPVHHEEISHSCWTTAWSPGRLYDSLSWPRHEHFRGQAMWVNVSINRNFILSVRLLCRASSNYALEMYPWIWKGTVWNKTNEFIPCWSNVNIFFLVHLSDSKGFCEWYVHMYVYVYTHDSTQCSFIVADICFFNYFLSCKTFSNHIFGIIKIFKY